MVSSNLIRAMFDSNVWHVLESAPGYIDELEINVIASKLEILTTSIQESENKASPSYYNFQRIKNRLNTKEVPATGFVLDFSTLGIDEIGAPDSKWIVLGGNHNRDEVIAETCEKAGAWLVTQEKKRLRNLAIRNGLIVYSIEEFLVVLAK